MDEHTEELSVADTRKNLADVINAASAHGRITYITSRGRRSQQSSPSPSPQAKRTPALHASVSRMALTPALKGGALAKMGDRAVRSPAPDAHRAAPARP